MAEISRMLEVYDIFSNLFGSENAMKIMLLVDDGINNISNTSLALEVYEVFRKRLSEEDAKLVVLAFCS